MAVTTVPNESSRNNPLKTIPASGPVAVPASLSRTEGSTPLLPVAAMLTLTLPAGYDARLLEVRDAIKKMLAEVPGLSIRIMLTT